MSIKRRHDIQHNDTQLNDIQHKWHSTEHYVQGRFAECHDLFIVMLNAIMLSVVMLNVAILGVIMLNVAVLGVVMMNVVAPIETYHGQ